MSETLQAGETDVVIIGAGVSGIGAAHHLQTRAPDRSYVILEAREAMGGTWDLFRYPGIRSDSDMSTFGYAFRPWTDGKVFADGPAIKRYVEATARDGGIDRHIRFGRRVTACDWDSKAARWRITAKGDEGEEVFVARFLMLCSGYYRYDRGHMPAFPGLERFKGEIVHPQLWREDVEYSGKRVVVIGSGATAITLVPEMAKTAAHVVMLQRSPTYIAARPSTDAAANALRKVLPAQLAHDVTRAKNIGLGLFFYNLAQAYPEFVRKSVLKNIRARLGDDFPVEKHFSPRYKPWDQRFCLAPDGDFFDALADGSASVVTDTIKTFTAEGVELASGEVLEADLVVPATGLEIQIAGGAEIRVDGRPVNLPEHYTYRGMMLSQVPNAALAFGYTNASWTLKIDLTCERVCRMLNHMRRTGTDVAVATPPADIEPLPMLDFSSGYVQRALPNLPRQGSKPPWRTYQNYIKDMMTIRYGRLEDGHMQFLSAAGLEPATLRPQGLAGSAEPAMAAE